VAHGLVTSGAGLLASGSADNSIHIWTVRKGPCDASGTSDGWRLIASLRGHSAPITSLACHPLHQVGSDGLNASTPFVLISTAGDGEVKIWLCSPISKSPDDQDHQDPLDPLIAMASVYGHEGWSLIQTLKEGSHIMQSAAITFLPSDSTSLLLACGGTDKNICLYTCESTKTPISFEPVCVLSGPENWIRSLAFEHALKPDGDIEILLACASQDRFVRIWSIGHKGESATGSTTSDLDLIPRYAPPTRFTAPDGKVLGATLDAVLVGHEDWIHSVCWRPHPPSSTPSRPGPRSSLTLMTASMDRSMMLWSHIDGNEGLWTSHASIGDAGAQCLGYFTGCFSACDGGRRILAHGFTGALHLWEEGVIASSTSKLWEPKHALGGHFAPVMGCTWGGDGACLLTASEDQTVRLFTKVSGQWCEAGRPQIHGHDFSCISAVPNSAEDRSLVSSIYVSGSEEKMLRVFEAPQVFIDTLDLARGRPVEGLVKRKQCRAFGASIPALGLSNKAVFEGEASTKGEAKEGKSDGFPEGGSDFVPECAPSVSSGRPLEEHLAQNTLWPEIHKLYGHGDDIHCVSASHDGSLVASGCVAKSTSAAEIWIWQVGSWKGIAQLQAHTLTVIQLSWSHKDDMLASCSRDRTFSIFKRIRPDSCDGSDTFQLIQRVKNAHTRILWGISWSPDDSLLATGSRDELVKLWAVKSTHDGPPTVSEKPMIVLPSFQSAVTCLSIAPTSPSVSSFLLAIGLEDGTLCLWHIPREGSGGEPREFWRSSIFIRHAAAISALCWRSPGSTDGHDLELGTCGRDHAVAIYSVSL
jgi:elongator complex protein 2